MFLYILFIGIAAWFLWFWAMQLLELMERKESDFPGRMDKALWVVILIALPVIGVIVYCVWKGRRAEEAAFRKHSESEKGISGT